MSETQGVTFIKNHLMLIIFNEQVNATQSKKKTKRKKENLFITDQVLMLDDGSEFSYFYWVNVNTVNLSGKEIDIKFSQDSIQFTPIKSESKQILGIIIDLLQRILVPKKFQKVNVSSFYTEPPPITGRSIMCRFLGYYNPNTLVERENSNLFRLQVMIKTPILKLINFQSYQALISAIFHAMSFIKFVKHLDFGEDPSILNELTKNFEITRKLISLSFGCNDKTKFPDFLNKFISTESSIEGLSISSLALNSDECQDFIDKLNKKAISALGFHENSLLPEGFSTLQENINSMPSLIYLNFNSYSNLDLGSISSKISFITILSLSKCNLNLQKALTFILQNNFPNLSELDLSSNEVNSSFNLKESFPPQLSKLIVGDTNWKNSKNFISFLSFVFKKMNSVLKLNVYSAKFDDLNEWKNFFNKLIQIDFDLSSIHSIGWDFNPIHSSFFTFLENCSNLKTLSMNSFTVLKGNDNQLDSINKYIKSNKSKKIETLIFSSDDKLKTKFKNKISEIFNSLKKWKSLKTLDVSQNMIGDDGINDLKSLLSKNPIKLVSFDKSKPSSIQILIDFFTSLPQGCKSNFPCDDLATFLNSKEPNLDDFQKVICLSSNLLDEKNSDTITLKKEALPSSPPKKGKILPKPEKSPLDEPFFVFNDESYKSDLFLPEFVEREKYKPLLVKAKKSAKNSQKQKEEEEEVKEKNKSKKKLIKKKQEDDSEEEEEVKEKNKSKKKLIKKKQEDDSEEEEEVKEKNKSKKKSSRKVKDESESEYEEEEVKNKSKRKQIRRVTDESDDSEYEKVKSKRQKKSSRKVKNESESEESEYDENVRNISKRKRIKRVTDESDDSEYEKVKSKRKKKSSRKIKDYSEDSEYEEEKVTNKSKKKQMRKLQDNSEYDDDDYMKRSSKKSRRKRGNDNQSDDEYSYELKTRIKSTKKKSSRKILYESPSTTEYEDENDESNDDYDEDSEDRMKRNKRTMQQYEMRTLMKQGNRPNRKPSPKSLQGTTNRNNRSKSLYEMHTKKGHNSYLGKERDDNQRKRSNKFDVIDEKDSSSSEEKNQRSLKKSKKIPPKKIEFDESTSEGSNDSFEKRMLMKEKSAKNRVQQRQPPPLERSDEDDDYDSKVKSKIRFMDKNEDDEDDENNFTPKDPDWSFPLLFVPSPDDSKQIVDDLSEKYSVGNLLRYMYQS